MRVTELVTVSSASARGTSSPSTHSPTMRRRVAISVDHTVPATSAAAATCHGRARPRQPSTATVAEAQAVTICPATNTCLRFTASDITPEKAPSRNIGMVRAAVTIATARPEPVDVQREQRRGQHLERAHRIDTAADRPQAQERWGSHQRPEPVAGGRTIGEQSRLLRLACLVGVGRSPQCGAQVDQRAASRMMAPSIYRSGKGEHQGMNDTMTMPHFDRTAEDLGNIVELGHVNVTVPDQTKATAFYLMGLGLTRDPYLMAGLENMWVNVGRGQFHLPSRAPQVVRGTTALVLPDLEALLKRLDYVQKYLEGTQFSFREAGDVVEATCPWGNRIRVHAPDPARFGQMRVGMPYVEFDIPAKSDLAGDRAVLSGNPRRHRRRRNGRARRVCLGQHVGRQQSDLSPHQEEAAGV